MGAGRRRETFGALILFTSSIVAPTVTIEKQMPQSCHHTYFWNMFQVHTPRITCFSRTKESSSLTLFQHRNIKIPKSPTERLALPVCLLWRNDLLDDEGQHLTLHVRGCSGLARTLAEKWKAAPESTKAIYEELAAKEKRQYALDMVKWARQQQEEEPVQAEPKHETQSARFTEAEVPPQQSQVKQRVRRAEITVGTHNKRSSYQRRNNSEPALPKADSFCGTPETLQTGFPLTSQDTRPTMTSPREPESRAMAKRYENFGDFNACVPPAMKIEMPNQQQQSTTEPSLNNASAQLLHTFLQQPGMADFVSQKYTLLSQSISQQGESSLNNFAPIQQGVVSQKMNQTQLELPRPSPFETESQPSVPCVSDALMGNIESLDLETRHFLDDDSVFGDFFPLWSQKWRPKSIPSMQASPLHRKYLSTKPSMQVSLIKQFPNMRFIRWI